MTGFWSTEPAQSLPPPDGTGAMPESPHGTSSRNSCDSPGFACEQLSPATKVCVRLKVKVQVKLSGVTWHWRVLTVSSAHLRRSLPVSINSIIRPTSATSWLLACSRFLGTVLCLVEPESLKLDLIGLPEYGWVQPSLCGSWRCPKRVSPFMKNLRQPLDNLRTTLRQLLDKFETTLRQLLDNVETTLRQLWDNS